MANWDALQRCREFYNEYLRNKEDYSLEKRITLHPVTGSLR